MRRASRRHGFPLQISWSIRSSEINIHQQEKLNGTTTIAHSASSGEKVGADKEDAYLHSYDVTFIRAHHYHGADYLSCIWPGKGFSAKERIKESILLCTTKYQQIACLSIALVIWYLFVRPLGQHYTWSFTADTSLHASCGGLVLSHVCTVMPALSTDGSQSSWVETVISSL
ncbi:hypothetical protein GJ744_004163 [Endocarpon pusillum]|uniref:Uncharacterized protein n=1 Tax=Endocarpon pusillum TaxID=364733 RepID=A0A8H7ALV6_9EURO|nr:hypothetical protein GJ744_004163 [Endocarpon pusillum]